MDEEIAALLRRFGWTFVPGGEGEADVELRDAAGNLLAWIHHRPHYCDRGHWQVGVEAFAVHGLDGQDAFPRYFMRLETAKQELAEFMAWRVYKVRSGAASRPTTV